MVYFIQCTETERVKIGKADDPIQRLSAIRSHSPTHVVLLGAIQGGVKKERELHERLAEYNHHGEWFELPGDLLDQLKYLYNA